MSNGSSHPSWSLVADRCTPSDVEAWERTALFPLSVEPSDKLPETVVPQPKEVPAVPITVDNFLTESPFHEKPKIPRDRWERYVIPDPATGAPTSWTRMTTLSGTISDRHNLELWAQRMVLKGIAARPDLYAMAVATPLEDKKELNGIAESAKDAAQANSAANMGTAVHTFTEKHDRGEPLNVPEPWAGDIRAYDSMLRAHGLRVIPELIEQVCICPELQAAGTFDRIVMLPDGSLVIADVKTKGTMDWGRDDIAIQLAGYANATHMFIWDPAVGNWVLVPMPPVRKDFALVFHMPAGSNRCTLYRVDIAQGLEGARMCVQTREFRTRKDLMTEIPTPGLPGAPAESPAAPTPRVDATALVAAGQAAVAAQQAQHAAPATALQNDPYFVTQPAQPVAQQWGPSTRGEQNGAPGTWFQTPQGWHFIHDAQPQGDVVFTGPSVPLTPATPPAAGGQPPAVNGHAFPSGPVDFATLQPAAPPAADTPPWEDPATQSTPEPPAADEAQDAPKSAAVDDERWDAPDIHDKAWWQKHAKLLNLSDVGHRKTLAKRIQAHLRAQGIMAPEGSSPVEPNPAPAGDNSVAAADAAYERRTGEAFPVDGPDVGAPNETVQGWENRLRSAPGTEELSAVFREASAVSQWTPALASIGAERMKQLGISG
jgi:hypothetical protein